MEQKQERDVPKMSRERVRIAQFWTMTVFGLSGVSAGLAVTNLLWARYPAHARTVVSAIVGLIAAAQIAIMVMQFVEAQKSMREMREEWENTKTSIREELKTIYQNDPIQAARVMQSIEESFKL